MPRYPRVHAAGLLYHVIARGNDGEKIFLGQSDYQAFVEALRTVRQRYPFSLYVYVDAVDCVCLIYCPWNPGQLNLTLPPFDPSPLPKFWPTDGVKFGFEVGF